MVQVAVLLCGVAAGLKSKSWKHAGTLTAAAFVAALVPQTILVARTPHEDIGAVYWLIQAASLAVGLSIARVLVTRRGSASSL